MEIKSDKSSVDIVSLVKLLLCITDAEKDSLIYALLENAYSYACDFTHADKIPSSVLAKMVCEDLSRASGVIKRARAGMSEEYTNGYSESVLSQLRALRGLRAL